MAITAVFPPVSFAERVEITLLLQPENSEPHLHFNLRYTQLIPNAISANVCDWWPQSRTLDLVA